ncbi:MAG: DUF4834 family protein [Bacteroidaceae bacterium]|nr:DUF4834 family protein [Bacteroidaceae bacterium]
MDIILFIIVILLIAVLAVFFIAAKFVINLKQKLFNFLGIGNDGQSHGGPSQQTNTKHESKEKIFDKNEGQYVDFEEVKGNE